MEQPIATEWDPLVASGEISWFVNDRKPNRLFLGVDLVHSPRAFWIGWSVEDHFSSPVPIEFGIEIGKTKVIQRSQWDNQEVGSLGRSYDPPFRKSVESSGMEWFWRLMVSATPRTGGAWGGLEMGVHPGVQNSEGNVGYLTVGAMGLGWFWPTAYGRIGATAHLVMVDDRLHGSIRIQGVSDFGRVSRANRSMESETLKRRNPVEPPDAGRPPAGWTEWPEGIERADSTNSPSAQTSS